MPRVTCCITMAAETAETVRQLVAAARTDQAVAARLGLPTTHQPSIARPKPNGYPRPLAQPEIDRLARIMQRPQLKTASKVIRAMHDPYIDPVLTSEAINTIGELYWEEPRVAPKASFISISRVIEALIMQASGALKIEARPNTAPASHDGQASHQSPDRTSRKTDAATRLHRGAGNRKRRVA